MLFKKHYFEKVCKDMSKRIINISMNSTIAIFIIWDVVTNYFYDLDIGKVVNSIEKYLLEHDFLSSLNLHLSKDFNTRIRKDNQRLEISFFKYYFSRLPVLLKRTHVTHHGRKLRPTNKEVKVISNACLLIWAKKYPELIKSYESSFLKEYWRIDKLTKWYVKSEKAENEIYNIEWLWDTLNSLYPQLMNSSDNISSITTHLIESYFPMFWNTIRDYWAHSLYSSDLTGWFKGDLTTGELIRNRKSNKVKDSD